MSEISQLLDDEIPKWRQQLLSNRHSLLEVAQYCRNQFRTGSDKQAALDQSRLYLVQSLASVAYQVNGLANGFLNLLDHGQLQLNDLRSAVSQLSESVAMSQERAARRQVGMLTQTRTAPLMLSSRIHGIVFPETLERPGRYQRSQLDVNALDGIGYGVKTPLQQQQQTGSVYYGTLGPGSITQSRGNRPASTTSSSGTGQMNSGSNLIGAMQQQQLQQTQSGASSTASGSTMGTARRGQLTSVGPQQYSALVPIAPPQIPATTSGGHQPDPYATLSRIRGSYLTGQWWGQASSQQAPNAEPQNGNGTAASVVIGGSTGARFSHVGPPASVSIPTNNGQSAVGPVGVEKVIASFDYTAERPDELSFKESSVIVVIKRNEDGWWEGALASDPSQRGLFPSNYVELV